METYLASLHDELVLDSGNQLCCAVCKCILATNEKLVLSHLRGKRHKKNRPRVSSEELALRKRKTEQSENEGPGTAHFKWTVSRDKLKKCEPESQMFSYVAHPTLRFLGTTDSCLKIPHVFNDMVECKVLAETTWPLDFLYMSSVRCTSWKVDPGHIPVSETPLVPRSSESVAKRSTHVPLEKLKVYHGNSELESDDLRSEVPKENRSQNCAAPFPPWVTFPRSQNLVKHYTAYRKLDVLHWEILDFARFAESPCDDRARSRILATICWVSETIWPRCTVRCFGSHAVGLNLPNSDIDVSISLIPDVDYSSACQKFAQVIRNLPGFVKHVQTVRARVPIVKFICQDSVSTRLVKCDVSFNRDSSVDFVKNIRKFVAKTPVIRPLVLTIKAMMTRGCLTSVECGGIPSYALLLLVYAHLETFESNFPDYPLNLGVFLVSFFELYGVKHNISFVRSTPGHVNYLRKQDLSITDPENLFRFSINDPNDEANEIGLHSDGASKIQQAFALAALRLRRWDGKMLSPLSTIIDIEQYVEKDSLEVRAR